MEWVLALIFSAVVIAAAQEAPPPPAPVEVVVMESAPTPSPTHCTNQSGEHLSRDLTQPFRDAVYMTSDNTLCELPRADLDEEPPQSTREQVH